MRKVSIHIVTYNSEEFIDKCLTAVLQQTYPVDRIIILDNNSSDNTITVLKKFTAPNIQIVLNESNTGFAPAHNQAIRMTKSDFFLVLNPDVILHPDYIRMLIENMLKIPGAGSATGKLCLKGFSDTIDSVGLTINKSRRAFDRGAGTHQVLWNQPAEIFGVSGAAALYSREMANEISIEDEFFDESFFAYKEDVDVAWRAQIYGWKSFYFPEATALHERGWKRGSRSKQSLMVREYSYINRYRMMLKNDSLKYILLHFIFIASFEVASFFYVLFREPQLLKMWKKLIGDIPRILKYRKIIKKNRKKELSILYSAFFK
ncbi:glycosyltransferase family 2 protein [Paenibacillus sp. J2TS4]|uniref:glycosyltransferase family 2 protein n=1 Tax=Paenibacillus sp. J2TS4 TaxID=2807194 RepID=UPI001B0D4F21|nr:glycosyltransferase family 2 protein [Paenibacillus sp. J2TS4]GIP35111.1 glycosyl transferase [Paenibacillus sp. J2TS4]